MDGYGAFRFTVHVLYHSKGLLQTIYLLVYENNKLMYEVFGKWHTFDDAATFITPGCNQIGEAWAESFAGVLGQCPALAHLHIHGNGIEAVGKDRLQASWRGQASGLNL
jgi:hypothetical protein